jgi:hypothetical protein
MVHVDLGILGLILTIDVNVAHPIAVGGGAFAGAQLITIRSWAQIIVMDVE